MTPKDHKLMMAVLVTQLQLFKALIEILNSRGLLETGDMAAFLALIQSQQQATESLVVAAIQIYKTAATLVGVETGLGSEEL
jgi:hypothetical protein